MADDNSGGGGDNSGGDNSGGDARAGMGFAGTGSGLSGSGAGAASSGVGGGYSGSGGAGGGSAGGYSSGTGSTVGSFLGGMVGSSFGPVGSLAGKFLGGYIGGGGNFGFGSSASTGSNMGSSDPSGGGGGGGGGGGAFGSNLGSILGIASGINSMFNQPSTSSGSANSGDPFSPYRSGLAAEYAAALTPGGTTDINAMPGYTQYNTGVIQPAMEASQRAASSVGQLYSGGESAALQKIGQQGYSSFMTDYLNRLATGSGASANPLGGAQLANTVANQNQQATMQGIGAITQGVGGLTGLFGNNNPSSATDYSPGWIQSASQQMPSVDPANIDPTLEWSI